MSSPGNSLSSFIDDKMDDRTDTINSIFSNHQTPNLNLNFHLPSDLASGLIDPDTLVYRGTIAIGICVPLLVGLFMCRVYARGVVERVWEVEDWLVLTAWTGTVSYFGIMGTSIADHRNNSITYWIYISSIEYGLTVCILKLSILWLYRRVFAPPGQRRGFGILTIILILVLTSFYGSTTIVKIFACTPRDKILDPTVPGTCVDGHLLLDVCDSFNTVTDFLVLFLPARAVWGLEIGKVKKVLVILLFVFGICAPIFSAIRFAVRLDAVDNSKAIWTEPEILLWGAAELAFGITCICVPEIPQGCGRRARSQLRNASILRISAVTRLRRLKGNNDLETCSREENLYAPSATALSESEMEQQVNGTVEVGYHSDISRR